MTDEPQADFAVKPTLYGDKVLLRPFSVEADMPVLRAAMQDAEIGRLTGSENSSTDRPEWTDAEEQRIRDWYGTRHEQTDRLDLAVVDRATDTCVGEVVLNKWDAANNSCNFRIMLDASGQGRGLGTEATRLILAYGFEKLGLHRVTLTVFAFNPRAKRAYEKAGFVVEGLHREVLRYDGEWHDEYSMAVLATDWERHRGRPDV